MAGNQRAYDAAMKRASNLAWDKKWSRAIQEYEKALAEYPRDVTALTGLGLAYAETRQLQQALDTYKKAAELSPDNPEVIQRVGHMLERLAQWPEAADVYTMAADACLRVRDTSQAIELWRKAAILAPENIQAHDNLSRAYQTQGRVRPAAREHLIMARVLHRQKKTQDAIRHCQIAQELSPRNSEAREILEALKRGLPLPDGPTARLQPNAEGKRTLESFVVFDDIELGHAKAAGKGASPADLARERTLTKVASAVFAEDADPAIMQASLMLARAADFQTRGITDRAIEAYHNAIRSGTDTVEARFNLGLLYQEKRDFPRALEHLNRAIASADLAPGAHFAIAECYQAWSKPTDALPHLMQVLRSLDEQTVSEDQIEDLRTVYEQIGRQFVRSRNSQAAHRFVRSVLSFFHSSDWARQALNTRRQLDQLTGNGILITLAETLSEANSEVAVSAMHQVQDYLDRDMVFTALEECFWAIQQVPYYLPLHLRLADILITQGRLEEAVQKYTTIAETYQVRGERQRAVAIYRKALQLAPMDVQVREKLIAMLTENRQFDRAIEQYLAVADAYYQLAQVNRAIEKYTEALRYVTRGDPARHWEVNILHRIGDIYMQRLNWRQALRAYQRIKRVDEENERARSYLVDLYLKTGQQENALQEMDELIDFFKNKEQSAKALSLLKEMAQARPDELSIHIRLARLYLDLRMKQEAISELDTVGEIQLNTGQTQEAIRTIQAIIRLGPENPAAYRQLLSQLTSQ